MCLTIFEIGDANASTWLNLVFRLQKQNKKIKYLATDGNPVYSYYKFTDKHIVTKKETSLVESWNSKLRYYIPALAEKWKCYLSLKTVQMAMDFFNLVHNKRGVFI